jgi:hypothetical protein
LKINYPLCFIPDNNNKNPEQAGKSIAVPGVRLAGFNNNSQ